MDRSRQHLLTVVREHGTNLRAVSQAIGKNDAYLQQFVKRGSPKRLDQETRMAIASFLGISPEEMLPGGITKSQDQEQPSNHLKVEAAISAGAFTESGWISSENIAKVPIFPSSSIPKSAQYAVVVVGNSIDKKYKDGTYVICCRLDQFPGGLKDNMFVHAIRERAGIFEHTIKLYRRSLDGGSLWSHSDQPAHQTIINLDDPGSDLVEIRGICIGSWLPEQY